jgi:hypothetical protein
MKLSSRCCSRFDVERVGNATDVNEVFAHDGARCVKVIAVSQRGDRTPKHANILVPQPIRRDELAHELHAPGIIGDRQPDATSDSVLRPLNVRFSPMTIAVT